MRDTDKLSDHARYAIRDFQAAGIIPTPDEIVELSALGWQMECPEVRQYMARGIPVDVGGVRLWPMTLAASDWFRRVGCNLGAKGLAYAMAHCYAEDAECYYDDLRTAKRKVSRWQRSIRATVREITVAAWHVLAQDKDAEEPPNDTDGHGMTVGELSVQLAALCGATPDYWESKCSRTYALALLSAVLNRANESGRPLPTDPGIKAVRAFGWAEEKIKQRHAAEAESNG